MASIFDPHLCATVSFRLVATKPKKKVRGSVDMLGRRMWARNTKDSLQASIEIHHGSFRSTELIFSIYDIFFLFNFPVGGWSGWEISDNPFGSTSVVTYHDTGYGDKTPRFTAKVHQARLILGWFKILKQRPSCLPPQSLTARPWK